MPRRKSFAVAILIIYYFVLLAQNESHSLTGKSPNARGFSLILRDSLTPQIVVCYKKPATISSGFMRCPKCGCQDDKVIDSRASREGATIRRRRECIGCGYRFTTYEEIERGGLVVLKRDGRREDFSREKLLSGLRKACQKRPVSPKAIEELVERIVMDVTDKYEREVP